MIATGPIFQLEKQATLCNGLLVARRFTVELTDEAVAALAVALARAYVAPHRYVTDPDASVAPRLPTDDKPRKADFGEFLCHQLYEQIFGHQIRISRLWAKVSPNATQQGADTVSVLVDAGEPGRPFTAETKVRTGKISAVTLLGAIARSVEITKDPKYLAAAWSAGLDKLDAHPAARRAYAYAVAHHLALLDGTPPEELPAYERHAVIITDGADVDGATITSEWSATPPVSALSIVKIPRLSEIIEAVYSQAGTYKAGELQGTRTPGAVHLGEHTEPFKSGLGTPVDPIDLAHWRADQTSDPHPALEAALWYLADHDGIARARALRADGHPDPTTRALTELLSGKDQKARATAAQNALPIEGLLEVISTVLAKPGTLDLDRERIIEAADALPAIDDPAQRLAISATVEAVCYRLPRQPTRLLRTAGLAGERVLRAAASLYAGGIHAFWPSQTHALEAGLLSSPPKPFVLRVPTSGGKTALIALVAANALDHQPGSRVVVLAPTRALVNQLRTDLRKVFGGDPVVLALHGELELSDQLPADDGTDLVTVMTPERFDLDWRRSATIDELDPLEMGISAVIVDEAHYIGNRQRGAQLELALSRVLRAGIPVTLASSQLGDLPALAAWIGGDHTETDWQPAHHIRQAYFRRESAPANPDDPPTVEGALIDERGATETRLIIGPATSPRDPTRATTRVRDQGAALATQFASDGPVVLFSATKKNIPSLVDDLYARVKDHPPDNIDRLKRLADQLPAVATRDRELLHAGIGIHHRDVRPQLRRLVEQAARQGDLRYLVCTSTLLEGVDFSTRTVLMIYPQHGAQDIRVGDLRNLEGRAGRGGQHTCGRIVVFAPDESKARKKLTVFRTQLPPTRSQLDAAITLLQARADDAALGELEGFLLAAIAEAALTDGDLRLALEEVLGRSLYFAALNDIAKDKILDAAERRATTIRTGYPSEWLRVVYRTGLPAASCAVIRDSLNTIDLAQFTILGTVDSLVSPTLSSSDALKMLLREVLIDVPELRWPAEIDPSGAGAIIEAWLSGDEADKVSETTGETVVRIQHAFNALSGMGPWLIGATVEVIGYLTGLNHTSNARMHGALELDRLRSGTNSTGAARIAALGADRHEASKLWTAYRDAGAAGEFESWVENKRAEGTGEE